MIHYTGTSPQDSKFWLLNAEPDDAVEIGIWYAQPWRLDIYLDNFYQLPKNGYYNSAGQLLYRAPTYQGEYLPDVTSDPAGSSYFDRDTQILHIILKGNIPVTIRTNTRIFVNFEVPFLTVDEFFGERIVSNLASFFDIPPERIRIANAVREPGRRRRSASDTMVFTLEIANPPRDYTTSYNGDISHGQFLNITAKLVNMYQLNSTILETTLNITLVSLTVSEPPPSTDSPEWETVVSDSYQNQTEAVDSFIPPVLQVPTSMYLEREPTVIHEGAAFSVPPVLGMRDGTVSYYSA